MFATLLLAALSLGQTPADAVTVTRTGDLYYARDDAGTLWYSPDPAWIRVFVAGRNKPAPKPDPAETVKGSNFGVSLDKIETAPAAGWYGGNAPAAGPVAAGPKPETGRLHLTAVGPGAREVVKGWRRSQAFNSAEARMGERLAVQAYEDPADPMVAGVGLPNGGKPDVVIQNADGKVLARWPSDPGGDEVAGQLRRKDPDYRPENDPPGGKDPASEAVALVGEHAVAIGVGLFVLIVVLLWKRGDQ